ncbi:MAG: gfo/Idh/MocA family oxidoreductase [Chitinivibrionales bacterium]|nr:gfo/Idh/MocA family oxidoreductase [Chitinivibrionales bacterium]
MASKVRVGVIGAGWPAWQHMKGYQKVDGVEVVALCDVNEARLQGIADEYGVPKRYVSYEDMLQKEQPDAVSVCTPNALHSEMSIACMRAGAHVLCEKPMAASSEQARAMIDARDETGRLFMMGYMRRFGGEPRLLKRYIEKGRLGGIYFARTWTRRRHFIPGMGGWFTQKKLSGGGVLIDMGVHLLDLTLWLMGYPEVAEVCGASGSTFGSRGLGYHGTPVRQPDGSVLFDVDDYASAIVKFANGATLLFHGSWASHIKHDESSLELWGETAGARLNPLELYTAEDGVLQDIVPQTPKVNLFEAETAHFIECVRSGAQPMATAEEGLRTVELIERIYESSENGPAWQGGREPAKR